MALTFKGTKTPNKEVQHQRLLLGTLCGPQCGTSHGASVTVIRKRRRRVCVCMLRRMALCVVFNKCVLDSDHSTSARCVTQGWSWTPPALVWCLVLGLVGTALGVVDSGPNTHTHTRSERTHAHTQADVDDHTWETMWSHNAPITFGVWVHI